MTKKQQIINELMEGNNYAYPQMIREKLNKRSLASIEHWYSILKSRNAEKRIIIDMIIRVG